MKRLLVVTLAALLTATAASGLPIAASLFTALLPKPPPYPLRSPQAVDDAAKSYSERLTAYVDAWFDKRVGSQLPADLIPASTPAGITGFHLVRYTDIDPSTQWGIRAESDRVNVGASFTGYEDPHATYLVMPYVLAPFGATLVMQGEFPHARFFDVQLSPPLDGRLYYGKAGFGIHETPIVDADISPLPGNTNPFSLGANRRAGQRAYRVTFALAAGDPSLRNSGLREPAFREPANILRAGAGFAYVGPNPLGTHGAGALAAFSTAALWIRYYAADRGTNAYAMGRYAGVALPKVWYVDHAGRRHFIAADISQWSATINATAPIPATPPKEPSAAEGPEVGWYRAYGIPLELLDGPARAFGADSPATKQRIRSLDLGDASRGAEQPSWGHDSAASTDCIYANYLGRGMSLGAGKIAVLTGTLPTFPDTRNGLPVMTGAQLRYWSLTSYDATLSKKTLGLVVTSIMDDELVLDGERRYILVFSRPEDRPANATPSDGVTWVDWGPATRQSWTLRWISVADGWADASITPSTTKFPWPIGEWSEATYRPALLGINGQSALGNDLPTVHYVTASQFAALGAHPNPAAIPRWTGLTLFRGQRRNFGAHIRREDR